MNEMKSLKYNTIASILLNITTVISGFILPRLILNAYGSEVNGLINSVYKFLDLIAFLDMGTTAVVRSSLFKPLAEHNQPLTNQIISAAQQFFRKIGIVLVIYSIVLCIIFPQIADNIFDWIYTGTLIAAMAIGSFAQYFTGLVDQIFLTANQKEYVYSGLCIFTLVVNTICSVILIRCGLSIQIVKFTTAFIYLIRPLVIRLYIKKHYSLNRKEKYDENPIPQRWSGVAQHISFKILTGTDAIVLTIFSSLSNVSVYSIYYMVLTGVDSLLTSFTNGLIPRLGNLWAEEKYVQVQKEYRWYEWFFHLGVSFAYGCTVSLIIPFVRVYTSGVNDADYIQPVFAVLISIAYAMLTMAQFDVIIIHAANHFSQTQIYYIISATLNLFISIISVCKFGLSGVAIGTLVAMFFQYMWTQWYMSKKLFNTNILGALKQLLADGIIIAGTYILMRKINLINISYLAWSFMALKCAVICSILTLLVNIVFYFHNVKKLLHIQ